MTTDTTEIQRIVRNYYEQLYANYTTIFNYMNNYKKVENRGEMDKFLENIIFQHWMKKKQKAWTDQ